MEANYESVLDDVKGLLADSSFEIANRAAKRIKLDNPELMSAGNRDQYRHIAKVLRKIEKAANYILKDDSENSIACLSEGQQLIDHRQKLIRLAIREEKG